MSDGVVVRKLEFADWQALRALRLQALKAHPGVFLGVYEKEAAEPDAYWHVTLDGKGKQVFGLFEGGALCGIAAVFTWRNDPTGESGVMAMDYIAPSHRGRGLMRLLYQARIDWALTQMQFRRLVISHRDGNEASRRAMVAAGFVFKDKAVIDWPDGTRAPEWNYTLDLDALRAVQGAG